MSLSFGAVSASHFIVRNHVSECFVWGAITWVVIAARVSSTFAVSDINMMNGLLLIIRKDTPVNFIGTTVSELVDRINEMHLEDPLSEHDLYNIDRNANIGFGPIPDIGWLAMTIDLPFLEGTEIGDVSQGQLGMLMLEKGNEGMCGIETMMPK